MDRLIAKIEAARTQLIERRGALISAAVTGKIDVRNLDELKAPMTEKHREKKFEEELVGSPGRPRLGEAIRPRTTAHSPSTPTT